MAHPGSWWMVACHVQLAIRPDTDMPVAFGLLAGRPKSTMTPPTLVLWRSVTLGRHSLAASTALFHLLLEFARSIAPFASSVDVWLLLSSCWPNSSVIFLVFTSLVFVAFKNCFNLDFQICFTRNCPLIHWTFILLTMCVILLTTSVSLSHHNKDYGWMDGCLSKIQMSPNQVDNVVLCPACLLFVKLTL